MDTDPVGSIVPCMETQKEMNTSMLGDKFLSRMFRKVDTAVWDIMSGKLGIKTSNGDIATIESDGNEYSITINPFEEFGVSVPAFAQATPPESVKPGDLIFKGGSKPAWVTEVVDKPDGSKRFKTINPDGDNGNWTPPKVSMLGFDSGVLVVRSLFSMFPDSGGFDAFKGNLLPLMFMGGDSMDIDKMLPLMLMGSMGGLGAAGNNNLMQTMIMMQMLKGDGPLGGGRKPPFRG